MKNILFIVSHLGSGYQLLSNALNKNPRVQSFKIDKTYSHPLILERLTNNSHKLNNTAATYMDEILFNYSFSCAQCYECCKFIYVVREPRPALNNIIKLGYDHKCADLYYRYRLRRICEMAKRTPNAILLTFDDMISGRKNIEIEKYLNLKEHITIINDEIVPSDIINQDIIEQSQKSFERYLYFLKKYLVS